MSEENDENLTLKDVMVEIKQQRREFQNLREEVQGSSDSFSTEVKKLKKSKDIVWKYNGNKVQFDFNEDLNDNMSQVAWALANNKFDYSKKLCDELQTKLKRRNKLIRLADSSSGGWETVKQYETNPIASDSDDESKINKAESRALKRKRESSRGRTGATRSSCSRFPWGNSTFPGPNNVSNNGRGLFRGYGGNFNGFNGSASGNRSAVGRGAGPGPCFACGDSSHIRRYCPRVQKSFGAAGTHFGGKPE